jgi:hypothetical protein
MARHRLKPWLLPAALLAALVPVNARTFTSSQALAFGSFVAGPGGSITVSPSGARSSNGVIILPRSIATPAIFTNTDNGAKTATVTITLPGSVTLSSGANQMTVNSFTSSPSGTGIMSGGSLTIKVGATLTVGANQPKGNYSGSIPVTINY